MTGESVQRRVVEIKFNTDNDGFVVDPELTDAKLVGLNLRPDQLNIDVETLSGATSCFYSISCDGLVALRIDKIACLNISLDFFVSTGLSASGGKVNYDLIDSLFVEADDDQLARREAIVHQIADGSLVLFGNEPSCGCEISVVCKKIKIRSGF